MKVLVSGSSGLVGSAAVRYYAGRGARVVGLDNDMRAVFFGKPGSTAHVAARLKADCPTYRHVSVDVRDSERLTAIFRATSPDLIVHCAAQPSHDLAASITVTDFQVNAIGTLNMLQATREHARDAVFVHLSTNKVYGDRPNDIPLVELDKRWDFADPRYANGISEEMSVDQCSHSLFGASKLSADVMVQEYGRYFGMKTVAFRAGCITGAQHSGVEQHGFLSYLVKTALAGTPYTIYGYKGKQLRDQIHAMDVIQAAQLFFDNPRCGEVYNLGGEKANSVSLLESVEIITDLTSREMDLRYSDQHRVGDHICYYSDMTKFRAHYPGWSPAFTIEMIFDELVRERRLLSATG